MAMVLLRRRAVFFAFLLGAAGCFGERLEDLMKNDPDISEFYSFMEPSKSANFTLENKPCTIFAPINAAFQKLGDYRGETESLIAYHMITLPKTTDQLGSSYTSLSTDLSGSPIWITHISGSYHNDIYVNNARILVSQSNIQSNKRDFQQVLHKIDEVLIPTITPKGATNKVYNPTAWDFLENYDSIISNSQTPFRVRNFRQKVQQKGKQTVYSKEGGHTFFIPVDEGFGNDRAASIDEKIIDGHVIPGQVLFTTPTKKDVPYQTSANGDNNIRVVILFTQEQRGNTVVNYVKSHTLFGDGTHTPGVVLAEIVKPNIPVKNGVIHLIQKPLMVVDGSVKKLLEEQDGRILSNFFNAIKDAGPAGEEFLRTLDKGHDITLFAPCNRALEGDLTLNAILRDTPRFMDILKMHLVVDNRLYVDKIWQESQIRPLQVSTLNKGKNLYFNVLSTDINRTLSVEGGGVNATVIQPDLAATNGIIHVIDRVLGVPYSTVLDKLRTDPMLKSSYYLGNLQGFNYRLNDTRKRFTYFVPREKAWYDARVRLPTAIKTIFMKEYAYHATSTLERHLVIASESYSMERIKQLSNDTNTLGTYGKREVELPTVRGSLKLYVEERQDNINPESGNPSFVIIWKGEKIPVFRPNVECTNGIIHVIDAPFLKESDIQVSSAYVLGSNMVMMALSIYLLV
ncbi:unnamed protein product [Phyllotreta striolata]|uniref:FAS1 domain-containing protein n=1 Tax=Phyllotreta striolata TaxID=444603 RepID=A0A9N9XMR2_PHYSR|nr:unnamed protein product [Phyllotreta striolata]